MNRSKRRLADRLLNTTYQNPFSDIQSRTSSDKKITREFVPTSLFWKLFNDQHEIVVGTRGSGKTILMRMMRYSMLRNIDSVNAKRIISEKNFFALYVPMRCEFIESITSQKLTIDQQNEWFCFGVNCLIADSLIVELKSLLLDYSIEQQLMLEFELTRKMSYMWGIESLLTKTDLNELRTVVRKIYNTYYDKYNIDKPLAHSVPPVFVRSLCSSLAAVNVEIAEILNFENEPTWILCVDEAEYLKPNHMECISKVMRSESQHIAIKVADLPYYHDMGCPDKHRVHAAVGNDYKLTYVKMGEKEFANLTNVLCKTRLQPYFENEEISLETFLGSLGNDDYLDYYKAEFPKISSDADIRNGILSTISEGRRNTAQNTKNERVITQSVFKKLAPIYYLRQMYIRSQHGNSKPGWFAGAKMVRRISNGNPRIFLRIMDALFDKAQSSKLTPKVQSQTLRAFASKFCEETESLEKFGPEINEKLKSIAEVLKTNTHDGKLKEAGTTFRIVESEFDLQKEWIIIAIAYARLVVDDISINNGITMNSEFDLSNVFATQYWLPMRRNSNSPRISVSSNPADRYKSYIVTKPKTHDIAGQMTFLEEDKNDN